MSTQTSDNLEQQYHPLVQPLWEILTELAQHANDTDGAWVDEQKEEFYQESLITYAKQYFSFMNETLDIIEKLELAEKMTKELLKPTAGLGVNIGGMKFLSITDIQVVVRREFSKIFNRDGWGS